MKLVSGKTWFKSWSGMMLATLLAGTTVLAGCSSSDSEAGATTTDGKSVLKVEVFDRGNSPAGSTISDNYLTKLVNERFGAPNKIDVQYVPIPRSEELQKLNVLMASGGDVPDIVFTYDQGTFNRYAQQGGLTDLTDLLNQYGPNLKKFLGDDTLAYGQIEGKQFAIPGKRSVLGKYASYIRQDWLNDLKLPVPQTTDELYTTLTAFKEKDPGKVGNGLIPFGMTIAPAQYEPLLWSFVQQPLTDEQKYTLTQKLGSSDYPTLLPGFKDGLKFMNKLYNQGLISRDFGLDEDKKQLWQDVQNGKVGFYTEDAGELYFTYNGTYKNLQANVKGAKLTPTDVFTNNEGKHAKPEYASNGLYIMIPKSSSKAVEAIKYLDWMASGKNVFDMQNGVEGENYTLKNGVPVTKEDASQEAQNRLYNYGDMAIIANGKVAGTAEQNNDAYIMQVPEEYQADMRKSVEISNTDTIPPVNFNKPIEAEAKYGSALQDKYKQLIVKATMAPTAQFDATYDSLMKDYMSSGGQAILDERTKVFQAGGATK
ncbi:extracellular solute-binding protein [Paenibacillus campi]|uniref:extracellular solute-binding protein n=1 Tax=Paenibacillus campi TaxID=3106031 RepID=UPI002AFDD459|nr:extracellular solute-binding protein [Paenibacillus sp. SGZ-1014]